MDIKDIDRAINNIFSTPYNKNDTYTEIFTRLKEFRLLYLNQLLFLFCNKGKNIAALARNSYQHDNGFFKITLFDTIDKIYRIRMHYWTNPVLDSLEIQNIHNHRFCFFSLILRGGLQNRLWSASNNGILCSHFKYFPRTGKTKYTLAYNGELFLSDGSMSNYCAGDIYHMPSNELHTVGINTNSAVTLFLEERSKLTEYADVYSIRYPKENFSIDSPSLTPAQYVDTVRKILFLIE